MIAAGRRRHRVAWLASAVVLPVVLTAALFGRPEVPQTIAGPEAEPGTSSFSKVDAELTLRGNDLELQMRQPLRNPDVLAYLSDLLSADSLSPGALPGDAVLLGSVRAETVNRYSLPDSGPRGTVWLYSLAHQAVVDIAAIPGDQP